MGLLVAGRRRDTGIWLEPVNDKHAEWAEPVYVISVVARSPHILQFLKPHPDFRSQKPVISLFKSFSSRMSLDSLHIQQLDLATKKPGEIIKAILH